MNRRAWLLFAALSVIWGLPYLLIRVSVREVSPWFLVLVRTGGGALLLAPFVVRRGALAPLLRHWKALLAYTCAEIAVPWSLLFWAERRITSSLAALLVAAVPIVGAVLAHLTRTERLDGRRVAGLLLGIVGVGAVVGLDLAGSSPIAVVAMAGVTLGYAVGPLILARYLHDLPGVSVSAASMALCAVFFLPAALLARPTHPLSASVVASVVTLTVLCSAVAFVAFFVLISEAGPVRATVITYVNPAVAVLLGVAVLGEQFNAGAGAGFALILAGSFLATRPPRRGAPDEDRDAPEERHETDGPEETARTRSPTARTRSPKVPTVAEP